MNWNERKTEVLNAVQEANIENKEAISLILFVERKLNSAANAYDRGCSFEYVCDKFEDVKFMDAMKNLGNEGYWNSYTDAPEHKKDWDKYCEIVDYAKEFNMCDCIC